MTPIELERLSHDARWEIIEAARDLDVSVDREYLIRIGQISDGFPYYVHLISEKMFWEVFDDAEILSECRSVHFHRGVAEAVSSAQTTPWDFVKSSHNIILSEAKNLGSNLDPFTNGNRQRCFASLNMTATF